MARAKILYVDDERKRCEHHVNYVLFAHPDWGFHWAESAIDAIGKLDAVRFDLVILDLKMPLPPKPDPHGHTGPDECDQRVLGFQHFVWDECSDPDPDERLTGYYVLRYIRDPERWPPEGAVSGFQGTPGNVPVIIASAVPDDEYRRRVGTDITNPPVVEFMVKPVDEDTFVKTLEQALAPTRA